MAAAQRAPRPKQHPPLRIARRVFDLLDLPYAFSQLSLLMPEKFVSEARARGVELSLPLLEGLHRFGLLTPFARVKRDGRLIARLARAGDWQARQLAHWHPTGPRDLAEARNEDALFDPRDESFVGRRRLERSIGDLSYRSSEFLYSHHQLICLPILRRIPELAKWDREHRNVVGFDIWRPSLEDAQASIAARHELAIGLSALEAIYYPDVIERISLGFPHESLDYYRWLDKVGRTRVPRWLGIDGQWLADQASELLRHADAFDPLGDWLAIVREANRDRWPKLKGLARSALDLRIAAEMLLLCHEDLVKARRAKALPKSEGRFRGEFDTRLKRERKIDPLLTDFGLSPHPSLVLIVEGDTEMQILPRLMDHFGVRRGEDFISIHNAKSVNRDLSAFVAYLAPRTEPEDNGRYLALNRPATKILFVGDAEDKLATAADRREKHKLWVDRLLATVAAEHRTPVVRKALESLVHIDVWKRNGESFEYAHFTDLQIATAIDRLDNRPDAPTRQERIEIVGKLRAQRANLKKTMGPVSKVRLADELWPVLKQRIVKAQANNTHLRIPAVRALADAVDLARETGRRNIVIPLTEES